MTTTQADRRGSTLSRLSPRLAEEITNLNIEQRRAVLHDGNLAVLAGPGSGKTRLLVAKVGALLQGQLPPRRGVAAITYTNKAAQEVRRRLGDLGIHAERRLTTGTVHGWCLRAILRPYGALAGLPALTPGSIVDDRAVTELLGECFQQIGLATKPAYETTAITVIRRAIAAGLPLDDYDPKRIRAARLMDEKLADRGLYDFEALVGGALRVVRDRPRIAEILGARYAWLVVDEYQDLGPVLHRLVLALCDIGGSGVVAVGDPNQSVMGFTGADPRYLKELAQRDDFVEVPLRMNYRSGSAIIAASQTALDSQTGQRADPSRTDPGVVEPVEVTRGLDEHGAVVVEKIRQLLDANVSPESVAVLYPRRGPVLDAVTEALAAAGIPHVVERDRRLPTGPLADFLTACAARAAAGPQPGQVGSHFGKAGQVRRLHELADDYARLRQDSGKEHLPGKEAERRLARLLNASLPEVHPLADWLDQTVKELELDLLAAASLDQRDHMALGLLKDSADRHALTLTDLACHEVPREKITVTTYHSAKGREWDIVFLPGLVEGLMPRRIRDRYRRGWLEPRPGELAEARRTFYVALTRARDAVVLVHGPTWTDTRGVHRLGSSRFVKDLVRQLSFPSE